MAVRATLVESCTEREKKTMTTSHAPAGRAVAAPRSTASSLLVKVPAITALFWVVKILTTGMGESASDWLLNRGEGLPGLGLPGALIIDGGLFVVAFALQLAVRRYVPAVYWLAVSAIAVVGTVVADITHFLIGVPLGLVTVVCLAVIAATFALWQRTEKTVSIHSVTRGRRETYYWVMVFFTFILGTALGDFTASSLNLGFLGSIFLFAALMAATAVAYFRFHVNAIAAFWVAYVLTRPLGASIVDYLAVPPQEGGIDLGTGPVTWVSAAVIIALVAYMAVTHQRTTSSGSSPAAIGERAGR